MVQEKKKKGAKMGFGAGSWITICQIAIRTLFPMVSEAHQSLAQNSNSIFKALGIGQLG